MKTIFVSLVLIFLASMIAHSVTYNPYQSYFDTLEIAQPHSYNRFN